MKRKTSAKNSTRAKTTAKPTGKKTAKLGAKSANPKALDARSAVRKVRGSLKATAALETDSVTDGVIRAVAKSTDVRPIDGTSSLNSLGIDNNIKVAALAGKLGAEFPELKISVKTLATKLAPGNTLSKVTATVRANL